LIKFPAGLSLLAKASKIYFDAKVKILWQEWKTILTEGVSRFKDQNLIAFFTDRGGVGFATKGTKFGDLIVRSTQSDMKRELQLLTART
jgi:hypothetical protein